MKMNKKLVILGMSLLAICGTITSASAYTYKNGSEYQYVTHQDVPNYGRVSYQTNYGSKKVTNGEFATFYMTYKDAWLGNFAKLIDINKNTKSAEVGLEMNRAIATSEYGTSKGTVYFSAAMSSGLEPSNTCDVRFGFSADNLAF